MGGLGAGGGQPSDAPPEDLSATVDVTAKRRAMLKKGTGASAPLLPLSPLIEGQQRKQPTSAAETPAGRGGSGGSGGGGPGDRGAVSPSRSIRRGSGSKVTPPRSSDDDVMNFRSELERRRDARNLMKAITHTTPVHSYVEKRQKDEHGDATGGNGGGGSGGGEDRKVGAGDGDGGGSGGDASSLDGILEGSQQPRSSAQRRFLNRFVRNPDSSSSSSTPSSSTRSLTGGDSTTPAALKAG